MPPVSSTLRVLKLARILHEDAEFWVRDRGRHDGS